MDVGSNRGCGSAVIQGILGLFEVSADEGELMLL